MEQIHAMGRYLLISSCGKYPPPLQGIWGADGNQPGLEDSYGIPILIWLSLLQR